MRQWLVADLSVMDVHFQLWMVLIAALSCAGLLLCGPRATFADGKFYNEPNF
jgi:hypothetical protein